jgi:hypothetical protein
VLRQVVGSFCLLGFLAISHLAVAQDFSADVVKTGEEKIGVQKLYSTKDKIRFEVEGMGGNAAMAPNALILDEAQNTYVVLMSARHMYMEAPPVVTREIVSKFWRVQDVNDACPQWKKVAEESRTDKNWGSCSKVGSDTVNGRSAVKYEGVSAKGEKGHVWVDTKLHCVVKMDSGSGGFELRNIQEGSQPSSLFEVPAGYTKFDMGSMMQRSQ